MKLSDPTGSGGTTFLDRLIKSLTGIPTINLPTNAIQNTPLEASDIHKIYGSSQTFLDSYKQFEETVFDAMKDSKNLSYGNKVHDIDMMRKMGKIDLSVFNYETRRTLTDMLRDNVLQFDRLLSTAGIPGKEFPSANLYSALTQFDVNQTEKTNHAAIGFLQRTFFNVNPNKEGKLAFNFGVSNLLTSDALERAVIQQSTDFKPSGNVLTFDVETTGVTKGSQVRSFAGRVTNQAGDEISSFGTAFENLQMASARVRTKDGSVLLSQGVNVLEKSDNVKSMADGGAQFVSESKKLFNQFLDKNINHLSGHNIFFDLQKMAETLQGLDAYDDDAKRLMTSVFDRIANDKNFLIDTKETLSAYFSKKAEGLPDAQAKVARLLAPESLAKISIGGSTTPSSIENIVANSNILELIERDGDTALMNSIRRGSHIAKTDVHMQGALYKYQLSGELDFLDMTKLDSASDFVKSGRRQYLRSSAYTPTTNVADVAHLERSGIDYLSGAGAKNVTIDDVTGSELGLSTSAKGQLTYSKSAGSFQFTDSASSNVFNIDEGVAKSNISSRLQAISDVNNNISLSNFSYSDATKIEEANRARNAVQGISATTDSQQIIRSLGLTDEQFGTQVDLGSTFRQFGEPIRGQGIRDLQPVLAMGEKVITAYHQNAARAGLGFSSLNIQDRVMSVKLAQATSSIGEIAAGTERVSNSMAHAKHAGLLGEMGLSYFKTQSATRLVGQFDSTGAVPASKVMANFESMFDYSATTAADGGIVRTLKVKAFDDVDNIMDTSLNRFTLSYLSEADTPEGVGARINLVFGANKSLSDDESKRLAGFMLSNIDDHVDYLDDLNILQDIRTMDRTKLAAISSGSDAAERTRLTVDLAEKIREKGIVAGFVDGQPVQQIVQALMGGDLDIVDNDVRLANHHMRLVHAENGVLTLSAMRNTQSDLAIGLSDEMAQREAEQALNRANQIGEIFEEDPTARRAAESVVRTSKKSKVLSDEVDLTKKARTDFKSPMTDFYIKNKTKLGYAGIGLAAAGIGYYMSKKNRESDLYNETMKSQPTEPGNPRRAMQRSQASLASPQSTRRDPMVTAGIVGNLDRNKIGHSQMGPNKYNHLYGG
jgi:hypothetical protein